MDIPNKEDPVAQLARQLQESLVAWPPPHPGALEQAQVQVRTQTLKHVPHAEASIHQAMANKF